MTAAMRGPLRKRESSLWPREENDWYCEPRWCSERLFQVESFRGPVHDPCCGAGAIVESARAAGLTATGSDIADRVPGQFPVVDAMNDDTFRMNIVSNPPFKLCNGAAPLVARFLAMTALKVCLLLPSTWMNGAKRSKWIEDTPLRRVWLLAPRPAMPTGHAIADGLKPGNGTTDYAWYVWDLGYVGTPEIRWLRRDG